MAVIVERGQGLEDANAYGTSDEAQDYYTEMGYSDTPSDATVVRGARWLDARFSKRLKGTKSIGGQAMQWPRESVDDEDGNSIGSDEVPRRWREASFEVARKVSTDMKVDEGKVIQSIAAGSVSLVFATPAEERETLDFIKWLVEPYLTPAGRVSRGG